MRILITGSDGFIGTHLKPLLKRYELKDWDMTFGDDIFLDAFEIAVKKCDVVIHLAALTNVEDSRKNPKPYYMTNVFGTARVAYLCMKYNKKLIYPSTLHVFHPEVSNYAGSKTVAEGLVRICQMFTPTVILRLFNVFGKGMNNNSGSIINLFLKSKEIEVYGNGSATRDFIHVKDVVRIIRDALKPKWNGKIVEVGTGKATSIGKLAGIFSRHRGLTVVHLKDKKQIEWPIADIKMLEKLYKNKLKTNLEKDIENLCKN